MTENQRNLKSKAKRNRRGTQARKSTAKPEKLTRIYFTRVPAGPKRRFIVEVALDKKKNVVLQIFELQKDKNQTVRNKVRIYDKEFDKLLNTIQEVRKHVKENLLPDYSFTEYQSENENTNTIEQQSG